MALPDVDLRETSQGFQDDWNYSPWQAPTPGFLSSVASETSYRAESQAESYTTTPLPFDRFSVNYALEWKVTINKRPVGHETEQVSEIKPRQYWETHLKSKIDDLLKNKFSDRTLQVEDTNIIVSVNERGYKNKRLIKQFPKTKIDWHVVENQLVSWAESFPSRDLLVQITVNHKGMANQVSGHSRGRVHKRGASSATQHMLGERGAQIGAEESSLGRPSYWEAIYNLMRCPGPPCRLGPHCWRDPKDKLHHKLFPDHLREMVEYAERGNPILSHDDVPEYIREEIIRVEEQHKIRSKKSHHPGSSCPPINITNVLPTTTTSVSHQSTTNHDPTSTPTARFESTDRLNVHGSLDQAVHDYTQYKISHATNDTWKDGFRRAGDIAIQKGFDLDLLYKTGTKVFDGHDILEGLVKQYVRDIKFWIENYHQGNKGV